MSEHIAKTIEQFQQQVQELENQLISKKRLINSLCEADNLPPAYPETDVERSLNSAAGVRHDQFYGKKLATAVREVLTLRRHLGAASVQEIFDALKQGGYDFQSKNDDYAKRGLYQSLTKNSTTFHKLPTGRYGLKEWYPNARDRNAGKPEDKAHVDEDDKEGAVVGVGVDGWDGVMYDGEAAVKKPK